MLGIFEKNLSVLPFWQTSFFDHLEVVSDRWVGEGYTSAQRFDASRGRYTDGSEIRRSPVDMVNIPLFYHVSFGHPNGGFFSPDF